MTPRYPIVDHPSAWRAADHADGRWIHPLTAAQIDNLDAAVRAARGLRFSAVTRESFALPALAPLLARLRDELARGRGFALVRGIPVHRYSVDDLALLFWGVGTHLGTGVSQTGAAELIAHVVDRGPVSGLRRGFQTNREAHLHIDLADAVGLLCIRQARSGGRSMLASSVAAYNALARENPAALDVLFDGFAWDRREEHGPDESPYGPKIPVFSFADGTVRCRYNRGFIEAARRRSGVALTPAETAALDALDAAAARPDHVLPMDFQPGDIQLVSNYTVLHARAAYEDDPDSGKRRHLLRLWWLMDDPGTFTDEATVRFGPLRYGRLGLTAARVEALAAEGAVRARR